MSQFDEQPFTEAHLESPAYRERLMRKLNCLIAVLEVACGKVRHSLAQPEADTERLHRIQKNLQDTLDVCQRAKLALERREQLPPELPKHLVGVADERTPAPAAKAARQQVPSIEMASPESAQRLRARAPIAKTELASVDLDELTRLLQRG